MKVVRLLAIGTCRLYLPGDTPGTLFCQGLNRPQGQSAAGRIMSMRNSNDTTGYRNRDLPAYSACLIHLPGINNSKLQTFLSDVTATRYVHFVRYWRRNWRLKWSVPQQRSSLITSNFKCKISLHPNSRWYLSAASTTFHMQDYNRLTYFRPPEAPVIQSAA